MKQLQVRMEINGEQVPVGTLSYNTWQDAVFSYDKSYLEQYGRD